MKKQMKKKSLLVAPALAIALSASSVLADESAVNCQTIDQDSFKRCWSVGVGVGMSFLDPDEKTSSWDAGRDNDIALSLYVNYQFKPQWFAELSYSDLGESAVVDKNRIRALDGVIEYKVPALMLGYYPDVQRLLKQDAMKPFVKLGVSAIDSKSKPSSIPFEEQSSAQLALALGLDWALQRNWRVRTQFEWFDVDALSFNVSLAYTFAQ